MVWIKNQIPFKLQDFKVFIKFFLIMCVMSFLLSFMADNKNLKMRTLFYSMYFFVLLIITIIAKKIFINKVNERIGLWLLYLNIVFSNFGIPLTIYLLDDLSIVLLLEYTFSIIVFSIIFLLYQYIILKNSHKFSSEKIIGNLIAIPFILILLISAFLLFNDYSVGIIGIGVLFLVGSLKQYPRINMYFKLKNIDRYGDSLSLIENKKKDDKK